MKWFPAHVYWCDICKRRYMKRRYLKRHYKSNKHIHLIQNMKNAIAENTPLNDDIITNIMGFLIVKN